MIRTTVPLDSGGILPDFMIKRHIRIDPFVDKLVSEGVTSYGLSSFGYDIRVANKFKVFTNAYGETIDPKNMKSNCFVNIETDVLILPPNSFALAETVEYFEMPDNVLAICVGKSTYARCGIIVNVTPIEPGWCGKITLELSNTTSLPARIYANEGISQLLFIAGADGMNCETTYADRKGKYQNQKGLTLPFVQSQKENL